jgi:hypothetical protein
MKNPECAIFISRSSLAFYSIPLKNRAVLGTQKKVKLLFSFVMREHLNATRKPCQGIWVHNHFLMHNHAKFEGLREMKTVDRMEI